MQPEDPAFFTGWYQTVPLGGGRIVPGEQDCRPRWKAMRRLHDGLRGKHVLDLGAAEGFFSCACADLGADVTAVEMQPLTFDRLVYVVGQRNLADRIVPILTNAERFLVRDPQRADVVLSLNLIHHLAGPLLHLALIRDALTSGGVLYLEAPDEPGAGLRLRKRENYVLGNGLLRSILARFFGRVETVHAWKNSVGNARLMWECVK